MASLVAVPFCETPHRSPLFLSFPGDECFDSFLQTLLDGDEVLNNDPAGPTDQKEEASSQLFHQSTGQSSEGTLSHCREQSPESTDEDADDTVWRCLVPHGKGEKCACVQPPPASDEGAWELVGDNGKNNGEKVLRRHIRLLPEWGDAAAREAVAVSAETSGGENGKRLAGILRAKHVTDLRKRDILFICRAWKRASPFWRPRNRGRDRPRATDPRPRKRDRRTDELTPSFGAPQMPAAADGASPGESVGGAGPASCSKLDATTLTIQRAPLDILPGLSAEDTAVIHRRREEMIRIHEYVLEDELREWSLLPSATQRAIVAGRRCTMMLVGWMSSLLTAASTATAMAVAGGAAQGSFGRQMPGAAARRGYGLALPGFPPPPPPSAAVVLKGRQAPLDLAFRLLSEAVGALEGNLDNLFLSGFFLGHEMQGSEGMWRRRALCGRSMQALLDQSDYLLGVSTQARHKGVGDYLTTEAHVALAGAETCESLRALIERHTATASALIRDGAPPEPPREYPVPTGGLEYQAWEVMMTNGLRSVTKRLPRVTPEMVLEEWAAGSLLGNSPAPPRAAAEAAGSEAS